MATFIRTLILFMFLAVGIGSAVLVAGPDSPLAGSPLSTWRPFRTARKQEKSLAANARPKNEDRHQTGNGDRENASARSTPQTDSTDREYPIKAIGGIRLNAGDNQQDGNQQDGNQQDGYQQGGNQPNDSQQNNSRGDLIVTTRPRAAGSVQPIGTQIDQLGGLLEQLQKTMSQPPPTIDDVMNKAADERAADEDEDEDEDEATGTSEADLPPVEERLQVRDEGDGRTSISMYGADIRQVLDMFSVQGELNVLTGPSVTGPVFGTLSGVRLEDALDAVVRLGGFQAVRMGDFILVGTPAELIEMQRLSQRVVTRVYRPNYVSAAELTLLIAPLLSPEGSASVTSATATSSPAEQGISGGGGAAGGNSFAGNEVVVVRDLESVIADIDQIYGQLDTRPAQVSIEATILSVRLDDSNSFGVDFEALRNQAKVRLVSNSPLNSLASLSVSDGGLKFGFLDSNLSTFVEALETIGDANVVASPRLMCVNKQQAEILIGSELGYVSTTVTETAATQAVEFLEVGTQLRFRPFIADDGTIRLEIHPELSTGSVRIEGGFTLPDKEVTQVTTNIICPDGKTVIIGGLIREDLSLTTTQIPILGNIPVLGVLFRNQFETKDRRELIVLLTPRIVNLPEAHGEATQLGRSFMERHTIREDKMSVIGRQYHARRFARLAQAAWNAGDVVTARRYVNLSLQFNPQLFESVQLRQLVNAAHPEPESIDMHLRTGINPLHHATQDYSRRGVPWRPQGPPRTLVPPVTIKDDGQPGSRNEITPFHHYQPLIDN
jgi:type IV pilus assembly protein PilQ